MNPGTVSALEFDRIVEVCRGFALTPLGSRALGELAPRTDPRQIEQSLALTTEAVRLLTDNAGLALRAPDDFHVTLTALSVQGRAVEPLRLVALADFLDSLAQTCGAIRQVRSELTQLRALAERVASFSTETRAIREAIDASGAVQDQASPELRRLRERLRKQRTRLRGTLESYLRGRDTAKYLQDQVITERSGRFVLLVRAEHRHAIPGIVHATSASGASLFLEPLSTVEVNNEIVGLEEAEAEEVHRILLHLSDAFRARAAEFQQSLHVATEIDVAQAKARTAQLMGATAPGLSRDGRLELRSARHPLLVPAVMRRLDGGATERPEPVPIDLTLTPPTHVLVVTGPNTGGKTVALKTVGLLALMAQAGLHIPAEAGSAIPVFGSVFADIGDEQSIANSLSTFSGHIRNIAAMDRDLTQPALVLLDEVGAGTDPADGGALGTAIVDHFRARGALVVATTHDDALKAYASTTPGVTSAAFGFDTQTLEPTYRLIYGAAGASHAFEIAARHGLPASIVEAARVNRTARQAKLAEHLARLDRDLQALDHERRLVARERQQLADAEAHWAARGAELQQREEGLRRRLDAELRERLQAARHEIDRVVEETKQRAQELARDARRTPLSTGDTGAVRADARAALETIAHRAASRELPGDATGDAGGTPVADRRSLVPGTRVVVGPLGVEGEVQGVSGDDVEVSVRGKRLRVPRTAIRVLGGAATRPTVKVEVHAEARDSGSTDLNVIGQRVDDAIALADKFLDEALLGEQRTLRLIHGHGTGQLRRALARFLEGHPQVARFGAAPPEHGGSGVTVVELKG